MSDNDRLGVGIVANIPVLGHGAVSSTSGGDESGYARTGYYDKMLGIASYAVEQIGTHLHRSR